MRFRISAFGICIFARTAPFLLFDSDGVFNFVVIVVEMIDIKICSLVIASAHPSGKRAVCAKLYFFGITSAGGGEIAVSNQKGAVGVNVQILQ